MDIEEKSKEKLIDFILNLTNEECETIVSLLNEIEREQP